MRGLEVDIILVLNIFYAALSAFVFVTTGQAWAFAGFIASSWVVGLILKEEHMPQGPTP